MIRQLKYSSRFYKADQRPVHKVTGHTKQEVVPLVTITGLQGKELNTQVMGNLSAGEQMIDLDLSGISSGRYIYNVKVTTVTGTYSQSKILIKQ